MEFCVEWRRNDDQAGSLVKVDSAGGVGAVWPASPAALADFLNDMELTSEEGPAPAERGSNASEQWGELVMVRSDEGDVLFIDPERYWNAIHEVFRIHGNDPHPWRGLHQTPVL
jgi:hypothetical protein